MQESAYSAFGSTCPVHDLGGERIRWFCPRLISHAHVLEQALEEVLKLEFQANVTRLTVRLVSEGDLSPACIDLLASSGFQVEARILIGGVRNLFMTYVGKCKEERRSDLEDVRQERLLLDAITAQERKGPARILAEFRQLANFSVEQLDVNSLSPADIDRLIWMHNETFPTFPYDFRKKLAIMLEEPEIYLMASVRSSLDNQIYAFSNLEINTLKLDDGSRLCLAEYDNSMRVNSTPDHIEVKSLGGILRLQLAIMAGRFNVDLCHSESRAGLVAINDISYHLGMRFGGVLEKHLLISGQNDVAYKAPTRFENMNVWYLNRLVLKSIEAACEFGTEKFSPAE